MTDLLTSAQMRAIEAAAIASGTVTGLELMERAGRGVVEAVLAEWPELAAGTHTAAVLCGPGNNGGDGFVVARLLHEAGWGVQVFLYGDPERLPPDAKANHDRWLKLGAVVPVKRLNEELDARPGVEFDVIVDACFGIGLRGAVPEPVREALYHTFMGYLHGRLVAIDLPSGLCADSGRPLVPEVFEAPQWPALRGFIGECRLTVTFHAMKLGHVLDEGPRHCGRVVVKDIGLEAPQVGRSDGICRAARAWPDALGKRPGGHKFSHGHALVLSGGVGHGGAGRLAARGALRVGAGLVTLCCPPVAVIENAAQLNAVMLRAVADGPALAELLGDKRITALCLGPGLGVQRAAEMLAAALPAGRKTVIDADGLTALAGDAALIGRLHPACVLTPHAGEFARLFPDIAEKLSAPATTGPAFSKLDATREAARRAGCTVLFKGPDTVIADPSGEARINAAVYDRAAPWLATAGSGDVLAGVITGLLARGDGPLEAAGTGAWLHTEAARRFGPGLIAEDLPEALPGVFRALGL